MSVMRATMRALVDRGVELLPAAADPDWARLEQRFPLNVGDDFKAVYSLCDGFLVHDPGSWFALWTLTDIIDNQGCLSDCADGWVPIGDHLIHSDVIVARIFDERASVRLLYEERDLAPSLQEFLAFMASGAFDGPVKAG